MATKKTIEQAKRDKREGKSASTQAGEFVKAEIDAIKAGRTGAKSVKQAIAIGLSEARRAGIDLPPPKKAPAAVRAKAERDLEIGEEGAAHKVSATRAKAASQARKREGGAAITETALSQQARQAAAKRTPAERSAAAKKAAKTKGPAERSAAAKKAARTRAAKAAKA
ncbi:DUF6496 domain-containing protein [Luteimonas sp. BDR2-5]|uniref:DUF6496 domain-containing protein n=1 Tax=Proluteimonas luteida TaxID=2878685 RepID=UPI001E5101E2|nr:DUF6496 domain-containing protein [Luteimonas sp. BDR2-5]MCD9029001.1 DUF6496 domain-containing protein [Luteimonas sp. BDR2-5]